jgi:hypothetical protein
MTGEEAKRAVMAAIDREPEDLVIDEAGGPILLLIHSGRIMMMLPLYDPHVSVFIPEKVLTSLREQVAPEDAALCYIMPDEGGSYVGYWRKATDLHINAPGRDA